MIIDAAIAASKLAKKLAEQEQQKKSVLGTDNIPSNIQKNVGGDFKEVVIIAKKKKKEPVSEKDNTIIYIVFGILLLIIIIVSKK